MSKNISIGASESKGSTPRKLGFVLSSFLWLAVAGGALAFGPYAVHLYGRLMSKPVSHVASIPNLKSSSQGKNICVSGCESEQSKSVSNPSSSSPSSNTTGASYRPTRASNTPPQPSQAQIDAALNASMCSQNGIQWRSTLESEDQKDSLDLINYENQVAQMYFNKTISYSDALDLINRDISGYNSLYSQDFNYYISSVSKYGCTPAYTSPLQAPGCTDLTICVSQVPNR